MQRKLRRPTEHPPRRGKSLPLEKTKEVEEAKARLRKLGLHLPSKPEEELPEVPQKLSELTDQQLMSLFAQVTAWADYLNVRLVIAEIDEQSALTVLRKAEAITLIRENSKHKTLTLAKAHQKLDSEVGEWEEKFQTVKAFRKLTGVLYENCERSGALLSRELSRRLGRGDKQKRVARYAP